MKYYVTKLPSGITLRKQIEQYRPVREPGIVYRVTVWVLMATLGLLIAQAVVLWLSGGR